MTPTEFDDRQPTFRVFAVAFTVTTGVLIAAVAKGHGLIAARPVLAGFAALAAIMAITFARSPWRLRTVIEGASVEHTAARLAGSTTTRFAKRDVEAVEVVAKSPSRVVIALRDGRRLDALRPWELRGPVDVQKRHAHERAEPLARALGVSVRDA